MRFVVYLSGSINSILAWHQAHDSVADAVRVPKRFETRVLDELRGAGIIVGEPARGPRVVPTTVEVDALADWVADQLDAGSADGAMTTLLDALTALCQCECSCGYIHIVCGRA